MPLRAGGNGVKQLNSLLIARFTATSASVYVRLAPRSVGPVGGGPVTRRVRGISADPEVIANKLRQCAKPLTRPITDVLPGKIGNLRDIPRQPIRQCLMPVVRYELVA